MDEFKLIIVGQLKRFFCLNWKAKFKGWLLAFNYKTGPKAVLCASRRHLASLIDRQVWNLQYIIAQWLWYINFNDKLVEFEIWTITRGLYRTGMVVGMKQCTDHNIFLTIFRVSVVGPFLFWVLCRCTSCNVLVWTSILLKTIIN